MLVCSWACFNHVGVNEAPPEGSMLSGCEGLEWKGGEGEDKRNNKQMRNIKITNNKE